MYGQIRNVMLEKRLIKMVHAMQILKCKQGHILPISLDSNECGCHHDGKPCISVTCSECLKEWLKDDKFKMCETVIPLDAEGLKELQRLTQ